MQTKPVRHLSGGSRCGLDMNPTSLNKRYHNTAVMTDNYSRSFVDARADAGAKMSMFSLAPNPSTRTCIRTVYPYECRAESVIPRPC